MAEVYTYTDAASSTLTINKPLPGRYSFKINETHETTLYDGQMGDIVIFGLQNEVYMEQDKIKEAIDLLTKKLKQ